VADPKIRITADTSQAQAELKRLEKALENLDTASAGIAKGLAAITAAAAGMGYAILKTLEASGQLIDAAKAIGISVESLQALQHSAAQAGVGADQLNSTLIKLSGNLGSALSKGTGPAIDALNRLNIPLQQIATSKPDKQFQLIAEKLNAMTNPAERNALAIELFGKQGPRMLEVAKGLEAARQELEAMGLKLSELDVAALDEAGDSVDSLKSIFESGLKKAVADIAPYIIAIVNKIKDAIKEAGGFEAIWQKIKTAIKTALNIVLLTAAIGAILKMAQGAVALTVAIRSAGTAMALFNTIVMKNPLMLAVGAALLLSKVLGIDVTKSVGDALFGTLDMAKAQDQITDKALETADANKAGADAIKIGREEQEKALKALGETLIKLQQNTQYQRDILTYGKQEADVRKVISEEAAKLQKAGLAMTPVQEAALRKELELEQALKRQVDLRRQQADALVDSLGPVTTIGKELEKLEKLSLKFNQNMLDDEISEKFRKRAEDNNKMYEAINNGENSALVNQRAAVRKSIMLEVGKYNERLALDMKYGEDSRALYEMTVAANTNANLLNQEQYAQLIEAKKLLDAEYENNKIKAAEASSQRLQQIELDRIQNVLMANKSGIAQALSAEDSATLQKIGQQERQKAIVAERIAFEKKSDLEKAQFGVDQAANMFAALGKENKKAFEASKALNIASAIMNTYQAATKALATYPFPFGLIAAAGAIAAGMAQVSVIKSQQYSGRALGGPVMGGTPYLVGESGPELFTPNTTGSITRNQDLGSNAPTNINFTIIANDTQGFDQLLSSRKGVIQQIISDAMLERGQRSIV
jgi:methionine synthase II (cobalamin-independent)